MMPATFLAMSRVPPDMCAPVAAARVSAPIAVAVSAMVAARRRYGSHRPVVRSASPNGLAAVAATAGAAAVSMTSGSCSAP